ncbi:hypothetical protein NA78x_002898 [Anatilimnocola sp. NA78]|uniref:hypothetical protein n=1 Tax=Anatilimnocola sp. NA78 TaxID=3415683 RepID=UPI003CE55D56
MNPRCLLIPLGMSLPLVMSGCSSEPNERLAQFAEQSVQQQARQNETVAANAHEVTRATDGLVKADASARQELFAASREQQAALRFEARQIEQARQVLDTERRELAAERARETRSLTTMSALLQLAPLLLPLALIGYLLYLARQPDPDDAALCEVLLTEVTAEQPTLLAPSSLQNLPESPSADGPKSSD